MFVERKENNVSSTSKPTGSEKKSYLIPEGTMQLHHAVTRYYQQVAAQQQLSNCLINSFLVVFNVILFLAHVVKCCSDLFSELHDV